MFISLQVVRLVLKKFCITDNPTKFSIYEEYGEDSKEISLSLFHSLTHTHTHTQSQFLPPIPYIFTDRRLLSEEDHPLEILLDASCSYRDIKLVLRDETNSGETPSLCQSSQTSSRSSAEKRTSTETR